MTLRLRYSIVHLSILLLGFFVIVKGQRWRDGICNDVNSVRDFNSSAVLGRWYLISRTPGENDPARCIQYILYQSAFSSLQVTSNGRSREKYILPTFPTNDGASGITPQGSFYTLIATDYENYAVFYTCPNNLNPEEENVFIFARQSNPDDSYIEEAKESLEENGLDGAELINIDQENCPTDKEWLETEERTVVFGALG